MKNLLNEHELARSFTLYYKVKVISRTKPWLEACVVAQASPPAVVPPGVSPGGDPATETVAGTMAAGTGYPTTSL
jgi:hypothetical protein